MTTEEEESLKATLKAMSAEMKETKEEARRAATYAFIVIFADIIIGLVIWFRVLSS